MNIEVKHEPTTESRQHARKRSSVLRPCRNGCRESHARLARRRPQIRVAVQVGCQGVVEGDAAALDDRQLHPVLYHVAAGCWLKGKPSDFIGASIAKTRPTDCTDFKAWLIE
ncbi:hypothetical protein PSHT_13126 [Puccinia striiformis]|uniref:Uncharacterized protein n=1 Tax=Puccinia striiformis TaxID=27350 RepID=A0A2S4USI9_9BASI|nr:hypothetical protein PSHT_13126 [Puccinia striiformis]